MVDPISMHDLVIRGDGEILSPARRIGKDQKQAVSFADTLADFVRETDVLQKTADKALEDFGSGRVEDVHEVMLSLTRADLSFRMMLEGRNKLVDAYTELMRTQV